MKKAALIFIILLQFITINISGQPVANFTSQSNNNCAPKIVQFTDLSTGSPTSWFWDFGNGNTSVLQNPQAVYQVAGTYTVSLIVSNQSGTDTLIKPYYIDAYAPPVSNFYAKDTIGCFPFNVKFFDNSLPQSSAISTWYWDFGDGYASTAQSPSHVYTNGGLYTVYLNVKDANGCQNFFYRNHYIRVHELDASFSYMFENCKLPEIVNFTNTSTGNNLTYSWDFGDNTISPEAFPEHVYNSDGVFDVVLVATNESGCHDTAVNTIDITDFHADFQYSVSCGNDSIYSIHFHNASSLTPVSYYWDFGDGTNTGVENPTHSYPAGSSYATTFIATIDDICTDTIVKTYIPPSASFVIDSILSCEPPFIANFINQSQGTDSLTFLWNFGDGTSDTVTNPTHTYYSAVVPRVFLYVSNRFGCRDSVFANVRFLVPVADFVCDNDSGCAPLTVAFLDTSTSALSQITSYYWDFGDPSSGSDNYSTLEDPEHTYQHYGRYAVSLIINTEDNCSDTIVKQNFITVGVKPDTIDFDILPDDTICHHTTLSFTDLTSYSDPSISADHWCWEFKLNPAAMIWFSDYYPEMTCDDPNFMDVLNSLATVQNPEHYFGDIDYTIETLNYYGDQMYYFDYIPQWGTYDIGLIASYNGCPDTVVKQITTLPPSALPGYLMPVNQGVGVRRCSPPATYGFYNASLGWDEFYYLTVVDMQTGDTVVNVTNPYDTVFATFTNAGKYNVIVAVHNDSTGCTTETINEILLDSVYYGYSVNPKEACLSGNEFSFNDTTVSFFADVAYWYWDFGDGKRIFSGDTVYIAPDIFRFRYPHSKTDSLKPPEKDIHTYGTYGSPIHVYGDTGQYIVTSEVLVRIAYNKYCHYITTDTVYVQGSYAKMAFDTIGCRDVEIAFYDSTYSTTQVVYHEWDFGDSSSVSYFSDPLHIYSDTGLYRIKLIVRDSIGCTDSTEAYIRIMHPEAHFTTLFQEYCSGDTVAVIDSSFGDTLSYFWDFDDSYTDTSISAVHIYNQPGTYTISEKITDTYGCLDSAYHEIVIRPKPEPYFYSTPLWIACPPAPAVFFDTSSTTITGWFWDFGDQAVSTLQNPEHVYTIPGDYTITFIATNEFNCKDTIVKTDYIEVGGPRGMIYFHPDTICIPDTVTFFTDAIHTNYYLWDMGDGVILSASGNPDTITYAYHSPGIYIPSLTLQDSLGCIFVVPSDKKVFVEDIHADFAQDGLYCYSDNILFSNLSSVNFPANFLWSFGDGITEPTYSPYHSFDLSGNYSIILTVTSSLGCISEIEKEISVNKIPAFSISLPDSKGCIPLNFNFTIQNNSPPDTINSVLWNFGDGTSASGFTVSHTYTESGNYHINVSYQYAGGLCAEEIMSAISLYEQPVAGFSYLPLNPSMTAPTIQFYDQSSDATNWLWFFGNGDSAAVQNPSYMYQNSGEYIITQIVSNAETCFDTISHKIYITSKDIIKLPLAFTPNGDGLNDILSIIYSGNVELQEFKIFNRWGELVFETTDIDTGWDGMYKGKAQETGTFSYYVLAKTSDSSEQKLFKGTVELIR